MASMISPGDSAEFVPVGDEATVHEGAKPSPDSDWYCATGQPPRFRRNPDDEDGPDRIRVRALTAEEVVKIESSETGVIDAGKLGFISLNGEAKDFDSWPWFWKISIGRLVWAVTLNPLTVRRFSWMADQSPEPPSPESAPTSS